MSKTKVKVIIGGQDALFRITNSQNGSHLHIGEKFANYVGAWHDYDMMKAEIDLLISKEEWVIITINPMALHYLDKTLKSAENSYDSWFVFKDGKVQKLTDLYNPQWLSIIGIKFAFLRGKFE